ncbi:quinone-dependent dihydroorotate dehydrogenase [soil metagenome]
MIDRIYDVLKPAIFAVEPERIHDASISLLAKVSDHPSLVPLLTRLMRRQADPSHPVNAFGMQFSSPLGVAAGLDKNAVAFPALLSLGFSHVEVGTVTPRPQSGNPGPRVFRLIEDQALINSMGFPGRGIGEVVASLAKLKLDSMTVGCNIGPNRASVEAGDSTEDMVACYRAVASSASYVAVNISSPNTANLRELHQKQSLRELLSAINLERVSLVRKPLLLKISPDLNAHQLDELLDVAIEQEIDGIIATNTTTHRPATLRSASRSQVGGLSGLPLSRASAGIVRAIARRTAGALPVIAVGGIFTGADVVGAIMNGATLVQTYTGLVYRGPGMHRSIAAEIDWELHRHGVSSLEELRGVLIES